MTAIALQFPAGRNKPGRGLKRLVLNLINGFREAREISYRYHRFSRLSDAELTALGMRRQDLPRIALTGRSS